MFETYSYLSLDGKLDPSFPYDIPRDKLVKIYTSMVITRCVDNRMIILQRQGFLPFAMSSRGEEACAVASAAALDQKDWMYPQYRELGIMFWRGYSIQDYAHHMLGNAKDSNKGRQLSNHFGSRELNVMTVSCPVGTQIPQAAGCAYAMKLDNEEQVVIVYFGEGTTSQGDFHVGVNFAAVKKSPAIFFCRNNGYAISTPTTSQFASDGIAPKGVGYGIKAIRVDGNDVFAVYSAVMEAREICLQGKGPVLIEAMTYRLNAHSTADNCSIYRTKDEVEEKEKKCPIKRLKKHLISKEFWDERLEEVLLKQTEEEIDNAIEIAKQTAKPHFNTMFDDICCQTGKS